MYKFYKLIYKSDFEQAKKRSLMTATMGYEKWGWRVVGITPKAIIEIAKNNYFLPNGLQRDHFKKSRAETFNAIFQNDMYDFEKWWNWVWENDVTVLMTKDEHINHKHLTKKDYYKVNPKLGYFRNKAVIGMHFSRQKDGEFVKSLVKKYKLNISELL